MAEWSTRSGMHGPAAQARTHASRSAAQVGLVYSETSDTPTSPIELDPKELRIKRMQKGVRTAARLIIEMHTKGGRRYKPAMVTLTYRPDAEWNARHITAFMKCIREWSRRRNLDVPRLGGGTHQEGRHALPRPALAAEGLHDPQA